MDPNLLHLVLLLAYGPFFLMLFLFIVGLALKWSGDPGLLQWLINQTGPQQPVKRENSRNAHASKGEAGR